MGQSPTPTTEAGSQAGAVAKENALLSSEEGEVEMLILALLSPLYPFPKPAG